jgi:hypothetical protein
VCDSSQEQWRFDGGWSYAGAERISQNQLDEQSDSVEDVRYLYMTVDLWIYLGLSSVY